jgi:hypothetical protein
MNIFILDEDPKIAASYLIDKHIVKMTLETAQILCTVSNLKGFPAPYKSTHISHPTVKWTSLSSANWNWLCIHGLSISEEYTKRYNKIHKCQSIIEDLHRSTLTIWKDDLHYSQHSGFVQCMPEKYKQNNAIEAYRSYYRGEKKSFAKWKSPSIMPDWF